MKKTLVISMLVACLMLGLSVLGSAEENLVDYSTWEVFSLEPQDEALWTMKLEDGVVTVDNYGETFYPFLVSQPLDFEDYYFEATVVQIPVRRRTKAEEYPTQGIIFAVDLIEEAPTHELVIPMGKRYEFKRDGQELEGPDGYYLGYQIMYWRTFMLSMTAARVWRGPVAVHSIDNGAVTVPVDLGEKAVDPEEENTWAVERIGDTITFFLNGEELAQIEHELEVPGRVGFTFGMGTTVFKDVKLFKR